MATRPARSRASPPAEALVAALPVAEADVVEAVVDVAGVEVPVDETDLVVEALVEATEDDPEPVVEAVAPVAVVLAAHTAVVGRPVVTPAPAQI
jgi:hypothetical protein